MLGASFLRERPSFHLVLKFDQEISQTVQSGRRITLKVSTITGGTAQRAD